VPWQTFRGKPHNIYGFYGSSGLTLAEHRNYYLSQIAKYADCGSCYALSAADVLIHIEFVAFASGHLSGSRTRSFTL